MTPSKKAIHFSVQALISYLSLLQKERAFDPEKGARLKVEATSLLTQLEAMQSEDAAERFNHLVRELNALLPHGSYPLFVNDSLEEQVKGEIVAFEHYVSQELKADHLTLAEEAPLFNDSLTLWEGVGEKLSSKEGALQLNQLIHRLNGLVPESERYPFLEDDIYDQ